MANKDRVKPAPKRTAHSNSLILTRRKSPASTFFISCSIALIILSLASPLQASVPQQPSATAQPTTLTSVGKSGQPESSQAIAAKYRKLSHTELKAKLKTLKTQINDRLKAKEKVQERRLLKVLARDLIRSAYKERDLKMRQKLLDFGVQLNEHPQQTVDRLRKETEAKEAATRLLIVARNETDPVNQENLMTEAEKKIYWLETGKVIKDANELKKARQELAQNNKKNQKEGKDGAKANQKHDEKKKKPVGFKAKLNETEIARDLAMELVEKAKLTTDFNKKQEYLSEAYGLLHTPHISLRQYRDVEWKKRTIRMKSNELMSRVRTIKSEEKRIQLIERINEFYKNPIEEVSVIENAEKKAVYDEGKSMAIDLLKQAESDINPATQEVKIRAARDLVQFPITTLKNIQKKRKIELFMENVTPTCKPIVQKAIDLGLHNLEPVDFNSIKEKVQARIKLFSEGKPYEDTSKNGKGAKAAEPAFPSQTNLIDDRQVDSMLTSVFAMTLEKTYHKVVKHTHS